MSIWSPLRNVLPSFDSAPDTPKTESNPNQSLPTAPLPQSREVGGALAAFGSVKRHLRGFGVSTNVSPFYTKTVVSPLRAEPGLVPRPAQIRAPEANARMPRFVTSKHLNNVKTAVGDNDRTASRTVLELRHDEAFDRHLARSFPVQPNATDTEKQQHKQARGALLEAIRAAIPPEARGEPPFAKANYLGHALAEASGGDVQRAHNALRVLSDEIGAPDEQHGSDEFAMAQRDAFATRCAMARWRASFRALRDIEPAQLKRLANEPHEMRIQEEADWQTWRAAGTLLASWPSGNAELPPPRDLDELAQAVNTMLPLHERVGPDSGSVDPGSPQARVSTALARQTQAAKALLCGIELLGSVYAEPPIHLRRAYLAHRNGISEQDVGLVQNRMYALIKYAQRNTTSARTGSWFERTAQRFRNGIKRPFGGDKNPLAALKMGTAGGLMDYPEKDFSTLQSIDLVADELNKGVVASKGTQPGGEPDPEAMKAAVRAAALNQWKQSISAKGSLRDDTRLGRLQRRQIARDVAKALHTDKPTVRASEAFSDLPKMNAETLRKWATDADVDMQTRRDMNEKSGPGNRTLGENLERMQTIRQDRLPRPESPAANIDSLCHLIGHMPLTWSVQMSSGGVYGLDANVSENVAHALGMAGHPGVSVAPDIRALRGRHAVMEVGSSSHQGEIFIGTDKRITAHAGVSGFIGWSLAGGKVLAGASAVLRPWGRDISEPRGVVIRAPFRQSKDGGSDPDAWRSKLKDVLHVIGTSGPAGQMPRTKDDMWDGMANKFFADPDLLIGWMDNTSRTKYAAASISASARYTTPSKVRFGPVGTVELMRKSTRTRATDRSGAHTADKAGSSYSVALNVSATLVASPTPVLISGPGPFNSLSFSSAPLVGIGSTILQSGNGSTMRLHEQNGEIVPDLSFHDTEFTSVNDYLQYVDSRNDAWVESMGGDQDALNRYQSTVKLGATRGNRSYGERRRMNPDVAVEINALRGVQRMYAAREQGGSTLSNDDHAEMLRIRGEIARLLEAPSSWINRSLFSYEANVAQSMTGLSYVMAAQSVRQVSAGRELSSLVARE